MTVKLYCMLVNLIYLENFLAVGAAVVHLCASTHTQNQ
jgi:hypothetical protein